MRKFAYGLLIGAVLSISAPAVAENRAVEISINGIGPAVDDAALQTVRQVIGHAVANGSIDTFIVRDYGIEGGFSACAEASPYAKVDTLRAFVRQLRSIRPDPRTTTYSVRLSASCSIPDSVCTQDAKLCPDGSAVSRVPPACEFAPCPGK